MLERSIDRSLEACARPLDLLSFIAAPKIDLRKGDVIKSARIARGNPPRYIGYSRRRKRGEVCRRVRLSSIRCRRRSAIADQQAIESDRSPRPVRRGMG